MTFCAFTAQLRFMLIGLLARRLGKSRASDHAERKDDV
jgi:hypothetical protein